MQIFVKKLTGEEILMEVPEHSRVIFENVKAELQNREEIHSDQCLLVVGLIRKDTWSELNADTNRSLDVRETCRRMSEMTIVKQEARSLTKNNVANTQIAGSSCQLPTSTVTSTQQANLDANNHTTISNNNFLEDCKFKYVLEAATSCATLVGEDTLTYLDQGLDYKIKLKLTKRPSMYHGQLSLKSYIRLRLLEMEKAKIASWQNKNPRSRILEVSKLSDESSGASNIVEPTDAINMVHFNWYPQNQNDEVEVSIKVNCLSMDFTDRKAGRQEGVIFRIQVDTYVENSELLDAAACQVKIYKKGGSKERYTKDENKIKDKLKKEKDKKKTERTKFQQSSDRTVLSIKDDTVLNNTPRMDPTASIESGIHQEADNAQLRSKVSDTTVPPQAKVEFNNQVCGQADGIQCYKTKLPELKIYVRHENTHIYEAVILSTHNTTVELLEKLSTLMDVPQHQVQDIYMLGPKSIHVQLNNDVITQYIKEEATFLVKILKENESYVFLLEPY